MPNHSKITELAYEHVGAGYESLEEFAENRFEILYIKPNLLGGKIDVLYAQRNRTNDPYDEMTLVVMQIAANGQVGRSYSTSYAH